MSQDEIAVMDGGKCILQLRGVRPFLSEKYDITLLSAVSTDTCFIHSVALRTSVYAGSDFISSNTAFGIYKIIKITHHL